MKYKKGDKFITQDGELELYYVNDFSDDDTGKRIIECHGDCSHTLFIPENELKFIDVTFNEKILNVLVGLASDIKNLNDSIEEIKEVLFTEVEQAEQDMIEDLSDVDDDDLKNKLN